MKRLFSLLALLSFVFSCQAFAARPSYPYSDTVAPNARHHILPWKTTVDFGIANFTSRDDIVNIVSLLMSRKPNLGEFKSADELATGILNKNVAALETWASLLAWLPGNLVIGPANRSDDPGESFDTKALKCLKQVNLDATYTDLFSLWNSPT
jgi:hypothetical protein